MSDNKKSNESVARFSEYVRQRLKTHPTQPDENCWGEIEVRLNQKRRFNLMWFGIPIAASILIAVFILHQSATKYEQEIADVKTFTLEDFESAETVADNKDIIAKITAKKMANKQSAAIHIADKTIEIGEEEEHAISTISVDIKKEESQETEETEETDEIDNEQKTIPKEQHQAIENLTAYNFPQSNQSKKRSNWQISAGLSSSGRFGSSLSSFDNNYLSEQQNSFPNLGLENGGNIGNVTEAKITNISHSLPFSIAITARKKINKTWGIETGLVYTYLSSYFEIEGSSRYDATLSLHYLGIPVNLIAYLWENKQWNIYISGGGMIEKGLRSVHKQNKYSGNSTFQSKEEKNIFGLQWSINGAVGISHNLYKEINLYIEPGISYYFDCNQPLSKRTEDPTNFNIQVGIRYDF